MPAPRSSVDLEAAATDGRRQRRAFLKPCIEAAEANNENEIPANTGKVSLAARCMQAVQPTKSTASTGKASLAARCMQAVQPTKSRESEAAELHLATLRRRALAALNLGLPTACDGEDEAVEIVEVQDSPVKKATTSTPRCSCLRRSGRCTCHEDRAWLLTKRHEASTYVAPCRRDTTTSSIVAPLEPRKRVAATALGDESNIRPGTEETDACSECTCLRRTGRCTCSLDAGWLQRKRRCIVPYVPPYAKDRVADLDRSRAKANAAPDSEGQFSSGGNLYGAASERGSVASGGGVNVRSLARQWGSRLENRGECRFNPLQMDGQIILQNLEGLVAECVEHPLSTKGVKGLPAIRGGCYQYEVELLRDCAVMVGWSGGMTLPGILDFQGYGYLSHGAKCHGQDTEAAYGEAFGKKGDIVGSLLAWKPSSENGAQQPDSLKISFCLNGRSLGPAFEVAADGKKEAPVPLQPHIQQLPDGPMMRVQLRGGSAGRPLVHPVDGYMPLSAVSETDFCPFSAAVAAAAAERVVAGVSPEQLRSFCLPDSHIAELYDIPVDEDIGTLTAAIASFLGLPVARAILSTPASAGSSASAGEMLHLRYTGPGATTAMLACRRPGHVERLIAASQGRLSFDVRSLCHAAAGSKELLREWRGEEFRPQADCSAARRLIHGCLQVPMPLSHIVEEKNCKLMSSDSMAR